MKKIYLNMKTLEGIETVDQFTQGIDSPENIREFRAYIRTMIHEYHLAGMPVYKSIRSTKNWKE